MIDGADASFCQELFRDPLGITITSFVALLTITTRLLPFINLGIRRIKRYVITAPITRLNKSSKRKDVRITTFWPWYYKINNAKFKLIYIKFYYYILSMCDCWRVFESDKICTETVIGSNHNASAHKRCKRSMGWDSWSEYSESLQSGSERSSEHLHCQALMRQENLDNRLEKGQKFHQTLH